MFKLINDLIFGGDLFLFKFKNIFKFLLKRFHLFGNLGFTVLSF